MVIAAVVLAGCGDPTSKATKTLKVVGDRSYAPYEFQDPTTKASKGLLVDLWSKWSERTGVSVEYVLDAWGESQKKVRTGNADIVGGIMRDSERDKDFDFVRQIMSVDEYVYFRTPTLPSSTDLSDFNQLITYVVGIVRDDEAVHMYKQHVPNKKYELKLYDSYDDLVKHAVDGEVDVFLMEQPVARYWLDSYDKSRAFQRSKTPIFSQMQYIAVRKGNDSLAALINDGFDQLSTQDVNSIRDKWEGYKINITEDDISFRFERFLSRYFWPLLIIFYVSSMLLLWTFLLICRPRTILSVNTALRDFDIPAIEIGPIKGVSATAIRWFLLAAPFEFLPRVLDDWIIANEAKIRSSFQSILTVQSKDVFYAPEVLFDQVAIADANSRDRETRIKALAAEVFRDSRVLLVVGEGGLGKTSFACWFGRQALAANRKQDPLKKPDGVFSNPMLPVFFEADLTETETVKAATRAKVSDLVGYDVSDALLEALVAENRIFVIVDGFSERSVSTQTKFTSLEASMRFRRMLLTSRSLDAGRGFPVAIIQPQRLAGPIIANFLASYIEIEKIGDIAFYQACTRISALIRTANVTPLFVALYGQMLNQTTTAPSTENAPQNIPDLVVEYLSTLNKRVGVSQRDFTNVLQAAKAASWACLQPNYIPGDASLPSIIYLTGQAKRPVEGEMVDYLTKPLGFLINTRGDSFKVSQDPLAEYLGAMFIIDPLVDSVGGNARDARIAWNMFRKFVEESTEQATIVPSGVIRAMIDVAKHKKGEMDPKIENQLADWEAKVSTAR